MRHLNRRRLRRTGGLRSVRAHAKFEAMNRFASRVRALLLASSALSSVGLASTVGVAAVAALTLVPSDARASVSIAVTFDALVKDADAVGVATPVESKSVWEEGRIITYTRVKVDQGVAGGTPTGSEAWVRTLGGVVGKIGQSVDGEPVFTMGKPALLFLRTVKAGTWQVSARAQGQFPVLVDDATKLRKVIRSANVGMLYPPKLVAPPTHGDAANANANGTGTTTQAPAQSVDPRALAATARLAGNVLHERPLDEATREIADAWQKAHPSDRK